jgi:carbon monoxide dehydrogenase subunit G
VILEGKIGVAVPPAALWEFLMDIDRFASCLPGLEQVTRIDECTFEGVVVAEVGPISGKFSFRSTITDSTPPSDLVVQTDGEDSVTHSHVTARLNLKLAEPLEKNTELSYRADIEIKGRLGILGDMVLRATSVLVLEEFARRLKVQLEK